MKIRKMVCIVVIFILTLVISNTAKAVEYREIDYTDRYDIVEEAFSEWIETFKSEETPENKRIIDYEIGSMSTSESNEERIRASIEFTVTPVSKENTEWNYGEPETQMLDGHEYIIFQPENICFIEMTNVNGEYQIDYIGETPNGYDAFSARFEEYKKTHPQENTENVQIQGQETTNNLANQQIEKMSNGIVIGCSIVLLSIICFIVIKMIRNRKK